MINDITDQTYMQKALDLARLGMMTAHPNPRVGCVVVKEGKIVGEGYHLAQGQPHAEVNALNDAGLNAKGATLYVTLEPCNHFGNTGPCVEALIQAEIKRVVVAMEDPNLLVQGKGIKALQDAGILVTVGVQKEEAFLLNQGYCTRMQKKPSLRAG